MNHSSRNCAEINATASISTGTAIALASCRVENLELVSEPRSLSKCLPHSAVRTREIFDFFWYMDVTRDSFNQCELLRKMKKSDDGSKTVNRCTKSVEAETKGGRTRIGSTARWTATKGCCLWTLHLTFRSLKVLPCLSYDRLT